MTESLAAEMAEAILSRPPEKRRDAMVKAVGMYRLLLLRDMHGATEATIEAAVDAFALDVRQRVAAAEPPS